MYNSPKYHVQCLDEEAMKLAPSMQQCGGTAPAPYVLLLIVNTEARLLPSRHIFSPKY